VGWEVSRWTGENAVSQIPVFLFPGFLLRNEGRPECWFLGFFSFNFYHNYPLSVLFGPLTKSIELFQPAKSPPQQGGKVNSKLFRSK